MGKPGICYGYDVCDPSTFKWIFSSRPKTPINVDLWTVHSVPILWYGFVRTSITKDFLEYSRFYGIYLWYRILFVQNYHSREWLELENG